MNASEIEKAANTYKKSKHFELKTKHLATSIHVSNAEQLTLRFDAFYWI